MGPACVARTDSPIVAHRILASPLRYCPNEALPGTHYCGLPAHQALEGQEQPVAEAIDDATADEAEELPPVAVEGTEEDAFEELESPIEPATAEVAAEGEQGAEA